VSGAKGGMVSGILNIDKPRGLTSHDVVDRVRRLAKQRRVGHAGTLDPLATGVLILCLGRATRIVEYLSESPKAYRATIRFGLVTDTWDLEGEVIEEREWQGLSLAEIQQVLPQFQGTIEQVPPMYSALKHQGKPLYKLARQGITIARKPRRVEIYRLSILDWCPPELVLEVECSKGTYIRSLAYELGQALGVGGCLVGLVRTAVGPFRLEDAVALSTLEEAKDWRRYLLPMDRALIGLPAVVLDEETARRLRFGQSIALGDAPEGHLLRAYDPAERLIAILEATASGLWKPQKVLLPPED